MSSSPTYLVAVSGGSIYLGYSPTKMTLATDGSGVLVNTPNVAMQDAPGSPNDTGDAKYHRFMYFCDGTSYYRLDSHTGKVTAWAGFSGTDAVSGDDITSVMPADSNDNTATMMCLYRGRIVLSGLPDDPHNWFMSAVGDPRNWDYSPPTTSAIQAVAGNNSRAGGVGDRITALAPYMDDLLIMGGDHTLWVMRGDPAAGGYIDNISQQIGIVGADAWTFDPANTFYFFGASGLFAMGLDGAVKPLSQNRLDKAFSDVSLASQRVLLEWDRGRKGLWIFITAATTSNATKQQWFWDQRSDTFWPIDLPDSNGPASVAIFDPPAAGDRTLLLGGDDGYVRRFQDMRANDNDGVTDDVGDDVAINSYVDLAPATPGGVSREVILGDLQVTLASQSSDVTLSVKTGATPEQAAGSGTQRFTQTLAGGLNVPNRKRVRAKSFVVRLAQNVKDKLWAYEDGEVSMAEAGRTRAGGST